MDEKTKNNEDILKKIGGAIGTIAISIFSGIIGFKLAQTIINFAENNAKKMKMPEDVREKYEEINKLDDVKIKLESIEKNINSSNWVNRYGAILVLFGELEVFIELLTIRMTKKKFPNRNLLKKLGTLKGERVISHMDYYLLEQIIPIRNKLVHGHYTGISEEDLKGAYRIIKDFIYKYYLNEIVISKK